MRVLFVARSENAHLARLGAAWAAMGWTVRRTDSKWPGPRSLTLSTARAVAGFRPQVAVLTDPAPTAAAVLDSFRVPYVVLATHGAVDGAAPTARHKRLFRRARAVIVARWADGRALADRYGTLDVATVVDGLPLSDHPRGEKREALKALGFFPQQRMAGLIANLDDRTRIDLLAGSYRAIAGLGIVVAGDGEGLDRIHAMSAAARPSSPVVPVGARSPAVDVTVACAATVGLDLEIPGPGDGILNFLVQGRRAVTLAGEDATPLLDLFPVELRAVHIARPTEVGLREGLAAALHAESDLGPLPSAAVEQARYQLDTATWPQRVADVLQACA